MDRVIALDGCLNFRDLGGYPAAGGRRLRWRQMFRSDALHALTTADVERLRREIGLATVVDLRSTAELRADGDGPLTDVGIAHHHVPLFDGESMRSDAAVMVVTLADRYFLLAEFAKGKIARVIETLSRSDGPSVYHCAAGKDRTGVISAVLLGALGVADELIVADYAATKENLDAIIERLMVTKGYETVLSSLPPDTLHAEAETMVSFLDRIRATYGSMYGYAIEAGVPAEALARLAERLLE